MIRLKHLIQESSLRGEWWIQDGSAIFADGDVGDMNHESYVIDILKRDILESLGVDVGDYETIPELYKFSKETFENIKDELSDEEKQKWLNGTNYDMFNIISSYFKKVNDLKTLEKLNYIISSNLDPREYALKHWGWQRMKSNVIHTNTLTSDDIKNIVNGVYDAYNDELEETDNDRVSENNPEGEHEFDIEVLSTRSFYQNIPISILRKRNSVALTGYRTRYE